MKTAIIYFILGFLFTFFAIRSVEDTVWNLTTILLLLIATLDFGVGIRFIRIHFHLKNKNKN